MTNIPKPTALKLLEGNRGKRPLPENEPKPMNVAPAMEMDIDTQAKKIWKRLSPLLEKLGLLTEIDGSAFAILCQIRARLVAIHRFIKKENKSLVQQSERPAPDGGVYYEYKASAYVNLEMKYYELFRKYASDFGLSPRGRTGLQVGITKKEDGDDLLT
jgi:P27 family predicted phage terminase small subunit